MPENASKNLRSRVRSYLLEGSQANAKTGSLMREAVDVEYILVENEHEALALENNLIKQRKPATRRRSGWGPGPDDECLLPLIRAIVAARASYGYRRVTALLNRQFEAQGRTRVNHKRIYRIMRLKHLLLRYRGRRERTH